MDNKQSLPEYWQRGPVKEIIPLLQPVVHAILQARDEVNEAMKDFPASLLWLRPGDIASVAFHLQHIAGVLDRLFTYASDAGLSTEQFLFLEKEGKENANITTQSLVLQLNVQVAKAIDQLKQTTTDSLLQSRGIGRSKIPTNTLGLLFHAAEHVQRHTGQLIVTAKLVKPK